MPTKFLESLGGKLAESWVANLLTPAFVFWAGGLGAWIWRYGGKPLLDWLKQQAEPLQVAVLVGSLLIITASAFIIQRFDLLVLRFLEGYWPGWMQPLRRSFLRRQASRLRRTNWRFQVLAKKQYEGLTHKELDRYLESYWPCWLRPLRHWLRPLRQGSPRRQEAKLSLEKQRFESLDKKRQEEGLTGLTVEEWDRYETLDLRRKQAKKKLQGLTAKENDEYATLNWQLMQLPAQPDKLMPTQLGNFLRAAEGRILDKYGLDVAICWPRMWLVFPDGIKKDLQEARADLNAAARFFLWSLLFPIWAVWAWWAIPAGLLSALFAYYRWALDAAVTYRDLLESAFDLHRTDLYKFLGWPMPANPAQERKLGLQLTMYLQSAALTKEDLENLTELKEYTWRGSE